ncbi:MAG: LytTR family DNA-binding domain-containing protein [Bacteroidota bacterium]|mgnify:CR=1 FL=1
MLNAIIVDDEARSRRILQQFIQEYCPSVTVLATAEDVLSGVKAINTHQPDVVFLDIEMPNYSGFKLIEFFDDVDFEIVFTTAYERYAIQAFRVSAVGYLLKPIDIDELIDVVKRLEAMRSMPNLKERLNNLKYNLNSDKPQRLVLPAQNGLLYVNLSELNYIESDGRYTRIHLIDKSTMTCTSSLKDCELIFEQAPFIRIHRSCIIHLAYIKRYSKGRDSFVMMENAVRLDVGKNYKDGLSEAVALFLK